MTRKATVLIISQVYVPDPASVGQHMADAAAELARRGHRVVVLASRRGYEDPHQVYPQRETLDGVDVRRLPWSSFGKRTIMCRLLGAVPFLIQVILHGLAIRRLDAILVSTSPPIGSLAALMIAALRRIPITYWAMDLNPDQAIALKVVSPNSLWVQLFNVLNRLILRRACHVVTLDRFMAQKLCQKWPAVENKLIVLPPWPHEHALAASNSGEQNPFRWRHGLEDKFVLMYSGNMSPVHPLETILQAALRLQHRKEMVFVFVGGGLGRQHVQEFIDCCQPTNVRLLPYQPLEWLRYSLSAADVHLVSMGDNMVGVAHPCKAYGAMACAKPVFLVGPRASHVGELIERLKIGWQIEHGQVDQTVALLEQILDGNRDELLAMGNRAHQAIVQEFSEAFLCGQFCDMVESTFSALSSAAPSSPASVANRSGNSAVNSDDKPVAVTPSLG